MSEGVEITLPKSRLLELIEISKAEAWIRGYIDGIEYAEKKAKKEAEGK